MDKKLFLMVALMAMIGPQVWSHCDGCCRNIG